MRSKGRVVSEGQGRSTFPRRSVSGPNAESVKAMPRRSNPTSKLGGAPKGSPMEALTAPASKTPVTPGARAQARPPAPAVGGRLAEAAVGRPAPLADAVAVVVDAGVDPATLRRRREA